jgi:hypothetical protein
MESHHKWNDYFRSHREFILATLFEPDRVHTAAGDVLCEVDGKLVKVRTLVDEIEQQTRGHASGNLGVRLRPESCRTGGKAWALRARSLDDVCPLQPKGSAKVVAGSS